VQFTAFANETRLNPEDLVERRLAGSVVIRRAEKVSYSASVPVVQVSGAISLHALPLHLRPGRPWEASIASPEFAATP
jgi:hypothetical protein